MWTNEIDRDMKIGGVNGREVRDLDLYIEM